MKISNQDSFQIEKAVCFLCGEYEKSGHNPKPVILHSLRVAFSLMDQSKSAQVVITAILHDLIEDSAVSLEELRDNFGDEVADNVASLSEDENIKDYKSRYKENFDRILQRGEEAISVKLADLYDNISYLELADDKEQKVILDKISDFLIIAEGITLGEMWDMLKKRYEEEMERVKEKNLIKNFVSVN